MRLQIKQRGAAAVTIDGIRLEDNVADLKASLSDKVNLPANHIRLVCNGRVWEDRYPIQHYVPQEEEELEVHCLEYIPPPQSSAVPTPNDPAAQLNSMGGIGGMGGMAGMSPDLMAQMMNSPIVQQMMSNPDTMRSLLRMNPEINDLLERQPDMARIFDDPEIFQQSLNAIRNPSMMREMMRQADRSMSNLETVPGGMDALRRMHTDFADPLYNAMQGSGPQAGGPQEYDQNTEGPINDAPLPNPWGGAGAPQAGAATPNTGAPGSRRAPGGAAVGAAQGAGRSGAGGIPGAVPFLSGMLPQASPAASQSPGADGAARSPQPPPFGANLFGMPMAPAPSAAPWGFGPGGPPAGSGARWLWNAPAPAETAVSEPAEDEFRLKIKYLNHDHLTVCKKAGTVDYLKRVLEPRLRLRAQYIRLVRGGQVWDNAAKLESLGPFDLDAEVYALKYVSPGEFDLGPPEPVTFIPPETRFASQLEQLASMGFTDTQRCVETLMRVDGDVCRALDMLLGSSS